MRKENILVGARKESALAMFHHVIASLIEQETGKKPSPRTIIEAREELSKWLAKGTSLPSKRFSFYTSFHFTHEF